MYGREGVSVIGLLIAAGRGRRMGGSKQLIPWPPPDGSGTLIGSAFDHIQVACDEMVVVLGHQQREVEEALVPRAYISVCADPDAEMSASIQLGLAQSLASKDCQCIILQPADHPEVSSQTLGALIEEACQNEVAVTPCYQGHNGHPMAIPRSLAQTIVDSEIPTGLSDWFRLNALSRKMIDVHDATVVVDIDTIEDVEKIIVSKNVSN
jgi:molybdenum cofactor cytidylyltransferase